MNKILLVIQREYRSRVKKKSFLVMTILGPVLIAAFFWAAMWISQQEKPLQHVVIVDPSSEFFGNYGFRDSERIKFTPDPSMTLEEFKNSNYDLMLNISEEVFKNKQIQLIYKKRPSVSTESFIRAQASKKLEEVLVRIDPKIDNEAFKKLKGALNWTLADADKKESGDWKKLFYLGMMLCVSIYMFIFIYGAQVMRGVLEEKTSRIVEVIVSSVKPFQLMMGKILGIALVALTQFVIWAVLSWIFILLIQQFFFPGIVDPENLAVIKNGDVDPVFGTLNQVEQNPVYDFIFYQVSYGVILSVFLFYFLGGYLLYASLFAIVGSAVDSEADTQQFMLPVTVPLIFGFVIAMLSLMNPEGPATFWFSIIPFTSPIVMMSRIPFGVPGWEVALSMILLILTFLFTTWLAGRIYRTGILMYGKKATYRELFKWIFSGK